MAVGSATGTAPAGAISDPLQRMVLSPGSGEAAGSVDQPRLRSDEWVGDCARCGQESVLTVVKADGRWTLRQLFGSWEDCDFDISCRRCGARWSAHLQGGEAVSVSEWLDQLRGTREPQPSPAGEDD